MLLDQEGFECDPISRREGDTPLHSAVRFINDLLPSDSNLESATSLLSMMLEAGSSPRTKNKANLTPAMLVDPKYPTIRQLLQDAIDFPQHSESDFVDARELNGLEEEEDLGDDYAGSASDSDFDPEEFRRERERQKTRGHGGMI